MEVYGRCDPCLHEDLGLRRDRLPGPLYPRNGKRPHTIQECATIPTLATHEKTR